MPEQSHLAEDRVDAAFDDRTEWPPFVGVNAQEMLGGQLNRRERILDLMGDLPRHLGPRLEPVRALELDALGLELASHAVERVHQAAQLVDRSHGNAGVEIAAGDALRRSGQPPDRVGNAFGERQPMAAPRRMKQRTARWTPRSRSSISRSMSRCRRAAGTVRIPSRSAARTGVAAMR